MMTITQKILKTRQLYRFCSENKGSFFDSSLKNSTKPELNNLEHLLQSRLSTEEYKAVSSIFYGNNCRPIQNSREAEELGQQYDFEVATYKIDCPKEELRPQRTVRIGVIQNRIQAPTDAPVSVQMQALRDWMIHAVEAAYKSGVNILCLQEIWTAPFFVCTRETQPWLEFGEDPYTGASTLLLKELAKKYNMVIVNPILERNDKTGLCHNTAVVINNNGNVMGIHHKNHIPRVGDFNESSYYMEGNTGHPVFETGFGRIAINICYGRHFPTNWSMFALNGAEIIFNPSATVGDLSEPLWAIEARNAAIANHCYTVGINRVGTEHYPNQFTSGDGQQAKNTFGMFYGSSYVASPDGARTPSLSRTEQGLLVTEVDLNLCRQVSDKWKFRMNGRWNLYSNGYQNYQDPSFKQQIIRD